MNDTRRLNTGGLQPGRLVLGERFRIERHIGSGGMGEVYLAQQVSLGRAVALKILRRELSGQAGMSERFRREARLLSSVEHPSVVRVIDFGEEPDGAVCLVMEYVEGESLELALRRGGFDLSRAIGVLRQLAEGLAAIHAQGIVHRDLKPANVLLASAPTGEQARLLDFGIARLVEPDENEGGLTQAGMVLGTPEYLSPEQALGSNVEPRSDLYSWGVVAYRLLAGRQPFSGPSARALLAQHIHEVPPRLEHVAPHLAQWPELVGLVHACLEKEPAKRPFSARTLVEGLRGAGMREPTGALVPRAEPVLARSDAAPGASPQFGGAPPKALPSFPRLARSRPAGAVLGLAAALTLLVFGYQAFFSLEAQAERFLDAGDGVAALKLLDAVPQADVSVNSALLRARALHHVERHLEETDVLRTVPDDALSGLSDAHIAELAEDLGKSRKGEGVRAVFKRLDDDRGVDVLTRLAEGDASMKQWGALRFLDAEGETSKLDLAQAYVTSLSLEPCAVRSQAARRLGELGDKDALPHLEKLASTPKRERLLVFAQDCGQDDARAAIRKLEADTR